MAEGQGPTAASVLVGLIGRGIQLSRSPVMHETEARAQGLSLVYRLIDPDRMAPPVPDLATLLRLAGDFGFSGLNVTFPYKQEVLLLLDELSPSARDLGSVNTVVLRDGKRLGHNTDMWGFRESFRRGMPGAALERVLLIGAGGAGVAVAHALCELGVGRLLIHDIDPSRAEALAERLSARFGGRAEAAGDAAAAAAGVQGIVNATPQGMTKLPGMPLPAKALRPDHWVADIIYFPLETELLRQARLLGCRTFSGAGMAVWQAVRAFELFTGRAADPQRMTAAFASFESAG